MELTEAITKRIIELQKQRKINSSKLALRAGLSDSTVSDVIRGVTRAPQISTLLHICEGFDIELKDFFDSEIFKDVIDEANDK